MTVVAASDTRIYCRIGRPQLAAWAAGEQVDLAPLVAHAATDRARAAYPQDDEEELEYAALWSAAESQPESQPEFEPDSRSRSGGGAGPVVVAALDVPTVAVREAGGADPDRGFEVAVEERVGPGRLVALHVLPADAGPDDELSWYDAGEVGAVLAMT